MLPDRPAAADRRGHDRVGDERAEAADEVGVARAEPRHHARRLAKQGRGGARLGPEEAVEAERLEREGSIHDAERRKEVADPGLRGERQRLARAPGLEGAEGRDREQDVAQRAGMDGERQGERRARAASCTRPFVASAVDV